MKLKLILLVSVCLTAMSASAGTIADTDSDAVPDVLDNCQVLANGPGTVGQCNQVDTDGDGFGDTCDADFDQDNVVAGSDFGALTAVFGTPSALHDLDCDGVVAGSDFGALLALFGSPPGP